MILELHLKRTSGGEGVLVWDTETGELAGFEAEAITKKAEADRKRGFSQNSITGLYAEGDPFHDPAVMGVLLSDLAFTLPEQILKYMPEPEPGIDEKDCGDVKIIY